MHWDVDSDQDDALQKYIWWFDTYPLEFAEFLLTSGLSRGIWLHPLSANDIGYMDNIAISEDIHQSGTLGNDTKSVRKVNPNPGDVEVSTPKILCPFGNCSVNTQQFEELNRIETDIFESPGNLSSRILLLQSDFFRRSFVEDQILGKSLSFLGVVEF